MATEEERIQAFDEFREFEDRLERLSEYNDRAERKYNHYHEMMETPDVPPWFSLTLELQERWINLIISEDNFDKEG